MANGYRVTLDGVASDGTNYYTEMRISDGTRTFPTVRPVFPVGTTAATITAYMQVIANNAPTLASDIAAIVNSSVTA